MSHRFGAVWKLQSGSATEKYEQPRRKGGKEPEQWPRGGGDHTPGESRGMRRGGGEGEGAALLAARGGVRRGAVPRRAWQRAEGLHVCAPRRLLRRVFC